MALLSDEMTSTMIQPQPRLTREDFVVLYRRYVLISLREALIRHWLAFPCDVTLLALGYI